jgi:hypothetical protein
MAAGLGFKDFVTGEVLTAADVDGYLMQGVWVFASAAARDAAVTSPQEGNFAYLKDTNVTTYYTGSAWANLDTTGMTNPMTTTGDTIYSSSGSTPARLGIGSTGQVLTVAGGVPSWATPASGGTAGLVLIHTETFSAQTSVSVNNKFSATYDNYVVRFNNVTASANTSINMRMRASGSDESSSNYKAQYLEILGTTVQGSRTTTATSFTTVTYINTTYMGAHIFELVNPFNTVVTSGATVQPNTSAGNIEGYVTSFGLNTTTSYDGLTVFTGSGNMTGSFSIYGYAK